MEGNGDMQEDIPGKAGRDRLREEEHTNHNERLPERDLDPSGSLELDELKKVVERYGVRGLSARYWTIPRPLQ